MNQIDYKKLTGRDYTVLMQRDDNVAMSFINFTNVEPNAFGRNQPEHLAQIPAKFRTSREQRNNWLSAKLTSDILRRIIQESRETYLKSTDGNF